MNLLITSWIITLLSCYIQSINSIASDGFYFNSQPQSQDVEEGQSVTLSCSVQPNDFIKYLWFKNGKEIETNLEYDHYTLKGGSNLHILHADARFDSATYECNAHNVSSGFSRVSRKANLTVYSMSPRTQVRLIEPKSLSEVVIGSRVVIACQTESIPMVLASNILWFRDGSMRMPDTKFTKDGTLVIEEFGIKHFGTYHCRAQHPAGNLDSKNSIVLYLTPETTFFKRSSHYEAVTYSNLDDSVKIACQDKETIMSDLDNEPIFHWTFTKSLGEKFSPMSDLNPDHIRLEEGSLIINKFDPSLVNYYNCHMSSFNDDNDATFLHRVEISHLENIKEESFSPLIQHNKPYPAILERPLKIKYYSDLTPQKSFFDENISNPPPVVKWFSHNSKTYLNANAQSAYDPFIDDDGYSLNFKKVLNNHAGRYTMSLQGHNLTSNITIEIIVVYEPVLSTESKFRDIDEDRSLTLDCIEPSVNLPKNGVSINWYKNGQRIPNENQSKLNIKSLSIEDDGTFNCSVKVAGFIDEFPGHDYTVKIRSKLRIVEPKQSTYFLEAGKEGYIPCRVTGYGHKSVQWYRGSEFLANPPKPANASAMHENSFYIASVQKSDENVYTCQAKSTYQNAAITKAIKLIVGHSPTIDEISGDTYSKVGSDISLNCLANGDPKPVISWIVKNETIRQDNTPSSLIRVFENGTLIKSSAALEDSAVYRCVSENEYGFKDVKEVNVSVLPENIYYKRLNGDANSRMSKMIAIVVGCALLYLVLMLAITIFCSIGMIQKKRNYFNYPKGYENGTHLISSGLPNPTMTTQINSDASEGHTRNGKYLNQTNGSCISTNSGRQPGYSLITDSNGYTDANLWNSHAQQSLANNNIPSNQQQQQTQHNWLPPNAMSPTLQYNN